MTSMASNEAYVASAVGAPDTGAPLCAGGGTASLAAYGAAGGLERGSQAHRLCPLVRPAGPIPLQCHGRCKGHEVERNLHLLTALGCMRLSPRPVSSCAWLPQHASAAAEYFARGGMGPEDVVVGLIPGSQWGTKRWPAERFAALIDHLASMQALRCALFGGPQDRPLAEAIRAKCTVAGAGPHRPDHFARAAGVSGALRGGREQRYGTNAHCGGSGTTDCGAVWTNHDRDGLCALWRALGGGQCVIGLSSLAMPMARSAVLCRTGAA